MILKHQITLTDDDFWKLIDNANQATQDDEEKVQWLIDTLSQRSEADIYAYGKIFYKYRANAYQADLWNAAYVINNGCHEDGFTNFRAWLIAQGKSVYDEALRDPETLVDIAPLVTSKWEIYGDADLENMNYVHWEAYEKKTGREFLLFAPSSYTPLKLQGELLSEEEALARYPKLAKKFWN